MFLAGYGGMVSLMQLTIAGFAGYMTAVFGVSGSANISLGWPWWLATPMAIALATLFGAISGALAVRTEGIYTIMITLAIASAFYYFTNQNMGHFQRPHRHQQRRHAAFLGRRLARGCPVLLSDAGGRRALLRRGRLSLARAVRAGAAGRARQSAPDGRARVQRQCPPRRRLCVRLVHRRRSAAFCRSGVPADFARLGRGRRRRSTFSSSPWSAASRRPIGPFIGALIFVLLRTFALDFLRRDRARRQSVPPADRARLPGHRACSRPTASSASGSAGATAAGPAARGRGGAAAMDSVAQRLSAVGTGNALELRGVTRLVRRARGADRHHADGAPGRAARGARLQRRRQDDAVQLHHRRFSADLRHHPLLRRGRDRFPALRAHPPRPAPHLSDLGAVSAASRFTTMSISPAAASRAAASRRSGRAATTRSMQCGRESRPGGASDANQGPPRRRARLWPAAPARDRARARRRAALHPVRRAGRRPVADRARRAGRDPDVAARRISATSSSSTTWTSRCASSRA